MIGLHIFHLCINLVCFCCSIYFYSLYKQEKEISDSWYRSACKSDFKLVDYRHDVKRAIKILQDIEKQDED